MTRNANYRDDLLEDIRNDSVFAAQYLSAAISDSREAFLVALRDVVEARKGMAKVAAEANVNRENLYRTLSQDGNPRFTTLESVLNVLGMDLIVKPKGSQGGSSKTTTDIGTVPSESISAGSTNLTGGILSRQLKTRNSLFSYGFSKKTGQEQVSVRVAPSEQLQPAA